MQQEGLDQVLAQREHPGVSFVGDGQLSNSPLPHEVTQRRAAEHLEAEEVELVEKVLHVRAAAAVHGHRVDGLAEVDTVDAREDSRELALDRNVQRVGYAAVRVL
jgi:hypothetical protein